MIKIILADNQAIFRTGAAKVLAVEDNFRIVAQCGEGERLSSAIDSFRGSVVIMASSLRPDFKAILEKIKAANSVGIITAEPGENTNAHLDAGYLGIIHRNISGPSLVDCVRRVSRGERWVQANGTDVSDDSDAVGARVRDRLTPKEMKIIGLIVQGFKNKEIAQTLGTTEQVIKNYLRGVYDKTGVSDRLELALFIIHHRILAEAAHQAGAALLNLPQAQAV
jgi:DNA-binding NarL/FixJ family response regulator